MVNSCPVFSVSIKTGSGNFTGSTVYRTSPLLVSSAVVQSVFLVWFRHWLSDVQSVSVWNQFRFEFFEA